MSMENHKYWVIILCSISLLCMLIAICSIVLFNRLSAKQPQENLHADELLQETDDLSLNNEDKTQHEQHDAKELEKDSPDIQAGQLPYPDVYVRQVPIKLEPDMEIHLAQFRSKARLLHQEFPESFLISIHTSEWEAPEKAIALTFDDGPDSSSTLEVVHILNEYGVPGTFFLIGQKISRYPDTIKAILDGGHTLANHSWSHIRPTDVSTEVVMDEVKKAQQQIADHDVSAKLYRPPYGLVNRSHMPALIEAGYQVVGWSIDSMDWYFEDPEQILACVVENAHPGAIVLMHSSGGPSNRKATIEALPGIIEALLKEGYCFVGLGQ
jgi:peptidoglycan/xylan/chitin deacetylase (PgdA/CDA1 family)